MAVCSQEKRHLTKSATSQWRETVLNGVGMKQATLSITLGLLITATPFLRAQARDIPSAGPTHPADQTQEQRGRKLLDQMLEALGDDAWLNRRNIRVLGHLGRFFQGPPKGIAYDFTSTHQCANPGLSNPHPPEDQRPR